MQLTLSADWFNPEPRTSRIVIGDYTGTVVAFLTGDGYQYTVMKGHLAILGTGQAKTLSQARENAESLIIAHAQAAQWERQAEVAR